MISLDDNIGRNPRGFEDFIFSTLLVFSQAFQNCVTVVKTKKKGSSPTCPSRDNIIYLIHSCRNFRLWEFLKYKRVLATVQCKQTPLQEEKAFSRNSSSWKTDSFIHSVSLWRDDKNLATVSNFAYWQPRKMKLNRKETLITPSHTREKQISLFFWANRIPPLTCISGTCVLT